MNYAYFQMSSFLKTFRNHLKVRDTNRNVISVALKVILSEENKDEVVFMCNNINHIWS